ncbi:TPA: transglycosylase SLT domain-containing protein [Enterobacter roggenkampii]|uniref:transglycosylase SLT domain-containing protein n=1 Tax=Enterobacter roggenkampii TaxID=1812935 RepID=UPI003BBE0632|nr:transglycosylase SLT domain-containing protein [Enterobacter roggenkampii]HCR1933100.1 transglycosylase SLT domain-containing protein [Enterobacter roggenkampii]
MADTIRDYLVSLGFDIDGAGQAKFEATLKGVAANVVKLGAVVESTALAVVGFTTSIANGLDKLYWASQRTGATVSGIKALGYAASQTGSSAEAAQNSLESLARFMRNNPGAEGFLNRLGVQTRDASGKMRDMSAIFTGVGQRLSSMPQYRANQYAQMLGIDENTLMAMRRGLGEFSSQYALTAKIIGLNTDAAAEKSNRFMTSMRGLVMVLGQARDKIGSNLAGGLTGSVDNLKKQLLDNWPKIEAVITKVVKGILFAADAISRMAWRVSQAVGGLIEWFKRLPPQVQQLIGLFAALVSAWRVLNTEFLKSPIGIIIALGTAILALIEDYQTWKEGGKSLIAWEKWEPEINAAIKSLGKLRDSVAEIGAEIAKLLNIDLKNWSIKGDIDNLTRQFGEFGKMIQMIGDLINALNEGRWSDAASIGKNLLGQGRGSPDAIPAVSDSANNTADWIKDNVGFDPRSIGKTVNGWLFGGSGQKSESRNERDPQIDELNGTQERSRKEAADYHGRSAGVLGKIADGIKQIADGILPPAGAATITPAIGENSPLPEVKRPQASAQGKVLLDWMQPMFNQLESLYRLPEGLLKSVAITESGGNQFATSGAGAKGLFQFMDGTARDMGLRGNDVFDPMKSAEAAAKYLSQLLTRNGGDLSKALASYNWGIGNVQRYGMDLMPQETRNYIPKVMSNMPGSGSQLSQETTINIYGANDPASTGREVADRQSGVNSRLTQQLQPRIY